MKMKNQKRTRGTTMRIDTRKGRKRSGDTVHRPRDIPYVTMYCKDECSSFLKDPQQDALNDRKDDKPMLKWHKVVWAIRDLEKKWRLLQKRKSALRMYYSRRFEEEAGRAYDESLHIMEANEHYTEGLRTLTNKLFRCFSSGLGLEEHG
ncbi:hypothetical protein Droror1_Dr00008457 [Drosera rotundifolia]